ncbi:MAG: hypothetical protein NNA22_07380 [Nitrospira sp.]|nr:hypothetical protein [Nitrospira sp.]
MTSIAETLKKIEGIHRHVVHPNEVKGVAESRGKTDRIDHRNRNRQPWAISRPLSAK